MFIKVNQFHSGCTKMKFSIKNFFSKCEQIESDLKLFLFNYQK